MNYCRTNASRARKLHPLGAIFAASVLLSTPLAAKAAAPRKGDQVAMDSVEEGTAADDPFHAMFLGWQKQDQVGPSGAISVPSVKPINMATFTSGFGVRSDPFRGSAAMHAGIDLAAPQGTAVYATADGVVDRAEWFGGYGNCVEVDHGKGVATRFGHLSRILVHSGQHVHRGDLIALVGSTGRSTGAHLHYECADRWPCGEPGAVPPGERLCRRHAPARHADGGRRSGRRRQLTRLVARRSRAYFAPMDDAIAITPAAAARVATIAGKQGRAAILRLAVEGGGCAGLPISLRADRHDRRGRCGGGV